MVQFLFPESFMQYIRLADVDDSILANLSILGRQGHTFSQFDAVKARCGRHRVFAKGVDRNKRPIYECLLHIFANGRDGSLSCFHNHRRCPGGWC